MNDSESLKDYQRVRQLAIRSLFEIIEQSSEGTVIVDRDANIVWMNERYARRFGLESAAFAIGKPCESVIPGSLLREVVRTGRPILLDMQDTPKEPLVVMRLPIHDDAGTVIGAIGFALFDELRSLSPMLKRYLSMQEELASTRSLLRARQTKYNFAHFIGTSAASLEVKRRARRGASAESPILLQGETGTGKELLAQAIHAASPRAHKPFVSINSAAIPEALLEAEFFGTAPGAFTGADRKGRPGKLQIAQGGSLFLDEIGDMPAGLQTRLLRVLQEKTVTPLGSRSAYPVEFALVCATHHDLPRQVQAGAFREDLLYRIQEYSLRIPPLRERAQLEAFILQLWRELGGERRDIRLLPEALAMLARYPWPGNVRQLLSTLKVLLALADDHTVLTLDDLPQSIAVLAPRQENADTGLEALQAAIDGAGGNLSRAAKALGVSRSTLYRKLGRQKAAS